ncbi:hypothetical protein EMPS_10761 [Entomortierella parvispora]|uniref:G domain-containing protein n=1 Tax=Entomortierella parvispora TaxID=205924 RepID=A0A9P3HKL9_9FUNG|nr:hypothetical protein EMPS_10761 [Entomortierella parvispora]
MTVTDTPKIILVMGITGVGKSHLVREVSGQDIKVGHGLNSCTQHIEEVCCEINGQSVLILDTPGFDDTERSDFQVLTEVADYLARLYKDDFRVSGILYLHNILENRVRGSALKNLQIFEKLCGEDSLQNVVMLTNRWGMMDEDQALEREEELKTEYWNLYLAAGCKVDRYRDKSDLDRIFESILCYRPAVLQIQRETVELNKPLDETAAGEVVNAELAKQEQIQREALEAMAEIQDRNTQEMKAAVEEEQMGLGNKKKQYEDDKLLKSREQQLAEKAAREAIERENMRLAEENEQREARLQQERIQWEQLQAELALEQARLYAAREHQRNMESRRRRRPFWKF